MKRPFEAYRSEHEANMALQRTHVTAEERAFLMERIFGNVARNSCKADCQQGRTCDCLVQFSGAMHPSQWIPRDRGIQVFEVPAKKRWANRWTRIKESIAAWWRES